MLKIKVNKVLSVEKNDDYFEAADGDQIIIWTSEDCCYPVTLLNIKKDSIICHDDEDDKEVEFKFKEINDIQEG